MQKKEKRKKERSQGGRVVMRWPREPLSPRGRAGSNPAPGAERCRGVVVASLGTVDPKTRVRVPAPASSPVTQKIQLLNQAKT